MRRSALLLVSAGLVLFTGCHSKKEEATPPPPVVAPAPPAALPTVALARLGTRESSALVLARLDGVVHAFVADEDEQSIVEIDQEAQTIVTTTKLGDRPRDLLVLGDGRLAATLPDAGAIAVLSRDTKAGLTESARVKTPSEPLAMAVDAKDETLYVTTGASHSLVAYDAKLTEQRRVSLGREPRAVAVHGDHAYVTHAIESFVSVVTADGAVTTTDIGNSATCAEGSHCASLRTARHAQAIVRFGVNGIVVPAAQVLPVPSPGFSKSALCPPSRKPLLAFDDLSPLQPRSGGGGYGFGDSEENGPPVTSDAAVLDAATGKKWAAALPPNMGAECILPRAAAADDRSILVACQGSSRVMRYTPAASADDEWRGKLTFDPKGKPPHAHFPNGVVPNVKATKIEVPAGPVAIAMDDHGEGFVWSQFAHRLSRIHADKAEMVVEVPRTAPLSAEWLAGRQLFYTNGDARISKDGRACASCHIDGADDGLAWKTPDGLRRTRLLRGELATGPYGWMGEHQTLKEHTEITLKNLKGKGLPEADLANLLTYVQQMKRPKVRPEADIERGKQVFATAECSHCHTAGSTDRQVHDVGTGGSFMTPTLVSANTRRALLHDGRFENLDELLTGTPNMGRGSMLDPDDRKALAAYLETL